MMILISYPLSVTTPLYPGTPDIEIHHLRSIANGDSANTSTMILSTHSGTHIDVPSHFCANGKTVSDILESQNEFFPTFLIDIPKKNSVITPNDIEPFADHLKGAKGLLIRTGMHRIRNIDQKQYTTENPWIHPDVPGFLRETIPDIRIVGTDTISISNTSQKADGRLCHRNFLCEYPEIMVMEDLDLSSNDIPDTSFRMVVYPWFFDHIDGVPVMVFAEDP
jgi:kynurenine formamidase